MTAEDIAETSPHPPSRWALALAVFGWSCGAACVAFTICYAYHIGI